MKGLIITKKLKWGFGVVLAIYSALWLIAEPYGIRPSHATFLILISITIFLFIMWFMLIRLIDYKRLILQHQTDLFELNNKHQLEIAQIKNNTPHSTCCVCSQSNGICPLGVTRIYDKVNDTLESSLLEAKHSYKWLGFTAFNVAHNHRDVFATKTDVKYSFLTLDPASKELLTQVDKDFRTTLRASEQALQAKKILIEIASELHADVSVTHFKQLPTFRIILIDGKKALVSFYEKGKDALQTPQIEFADNPDAKYCILNWFELFYEKVLHTERLLYQSNSFKSQLKK
jgi:hypothetical protein